MSVKAKEVLYIVILLLSCGIIMPIARNSARRVKYIITFPDVL
jgi:hypothetical protein